jgi:septal ring factor EnvC (AmiA/AmiB activator)
MIRKGLTLSSSLVAIALVAGCQTTADKQREADQAQAQADQKRTAAEEQANQKAAEAQNAAQQEITNAQRKADEKQNAVLAALTHEQADRLSKVNDALDDLRGKIAELQTAANAETVAKNQTADGRVLSDLIARREVLTADATAIPGATPTAWPGLEDKIDKDLDAFRSLARTASVHIKSAPR